MFSREFEDVDESQFVLDGKFGFGLGGADMDRQAGKAKGIAWGTRMAGRVEARVGRAELLRTPSSRMSYSLLGRWLQFPHWHKIYLVQCYPMA